MVEAVLVTRADWRNLTAADVPAIDNVLALTPNVHSVANDGPWPVIDVMSRYTDCAEARTVARVTKARRAALAAFVPASPAEREIVIDQINRVAYGACRLWYSLGAAGPWLVPAGDDFNLESDRMDAFRSVARHFLTPKIAGEAEAARITPPPFAGVYRLLRRLALRRHRQYKDGTVLKGRNLYQAERIAAYKRWAPRDQETGAPLAIMRCMCCNDSEGEAARFTGVLRVPPGLCTALGAHDARQATTSSSGPHGTRPRTRL